jgi:hypothetical protein
MSSTASKTAPRRELADELMTASQREEVLAFRKAARAYTKKVTRSRETAFQALVDAGFLTPKGNPCKQYR